MNNSRLIGVLETIGSFQANIVKNVRYRCGYSVYVVFVIMNSDYNVLNEVHNILASNNINSKITNGKLTINGLDELQKLSELIKQYKFLSTSRQKQFDNWTKIIEAISCQEHLNSDGINKIKKLKQTMFL